MKKIELIFFLPNLNLGGAGSSIYKLCKNLSNKYKITIISLTNNYYREKLNLNKISLIKLKVLKQFFHSRNKCNNQ